MKSTSRARALLGVVLTSALSLAAVAASANNAFAAAPDYSVNITASNANADASGNATVSFTVRNTGNRTLVDCHAGSSTRAQLAPGSSFSGTISAKVGTESVSVTCYENNGHNKSVSDSASVTIKAFGSSAGTSATSAPSANAGAAAHTGDDSGFPVGGLVGLVGMLVAGAGSAIGIYRKR